MRVFHADAVIMGDADAVADGAVVVDARGEIRDFGPAVEVLPRHAGAPVERIRGVLVPGLVNAHTHLELSALRGEVPGGAGFVPWVEQLIGARAEAEPHQDREAIGRAVDELVAFGTAAVGEVTNTLSAVRALAQRGVAGCVFHEVFGVQREALETRVAGLPHVLEETVGAWPSGDLTYSPTPHTLYTTHESVARKLIEEARERGLRASLHLCEHPSERRFLEHGDGPVSQWYERLLKIPQGTLAWPSMGPIALADAIGALAPHVLCVHLTDARPEELAIVAARGAPVVFCPRSNLFIETRLPPLLSAIAAGILPALGTDSLASNASLDVLAEARALGERFPTVKPRELVRMATWEGARALGLSDMGRVSRGARPGLFVVEGDVGASGDACAFLLAQVRAPRRWVARRERAAAEDFPQ
jgi:cytosine/adenosine deaminase-related metal-dependent hydrolase